MNSTSNPLVVLLGVGSGVGKSHISQGLCRLARWQGMRVELFKSLLVGSEAALSWRSISARSETTRSVQQIRNPCFFDVATRKLSVLGEPFGCYNLISSDNVDFSTMPRDVLQRVRQIVMDDLVYVRSVSDIVIVEGGGSCTDEPTHDFTNSFVAETGGAKVILVANAANGGFAPALIGTFSLLPATVQGKVCGFICNRAQPHARQVKYNLDLVTRHTGMECFGCIPCVDDATTHGASADEIAHHLTANALRELLFMQPQRSVSLNTWVSA